MLANVDGLEVRVSQETLQELINNKSCQIRKKIAQRSKLNEKGLRVRVVHGARTIIAFVEKITTKGVVTLNTTMPA